MAWRPSTMVACVRSFSIVSVCGGPPAATVGTLAGGSAGAFQPPRRASTSRRASSTVMAPTARARRERRPTPHPGKEVEPAAAAWPQHGARGAQAVAAGAGGEAAADALDGAVELRPRVLGGAARQERAGQVREARAVGRV